MPRQQNAALNWKHFQLLTICASKTKKRLKWIQNILIDVVKAELVQRVCSHCSPCASAPDTEGPLGICAETILAKLRPSEKSTWVCTSGTRAAWAEGRSSQGEQIPFLPGFCFLRVWFDSEPSPAQTPGRWIVWITQSCVAHLQQHSQWQRKELKVLSALQTGRKPVVTGWRMRDLFFHSPMMHTHSTWSWGSSRKVYTQAHIVC